MSRLREIGFKLTDSKGNTRLSCPTHPLESICESDKQSYWTVANHSLPPQSIEIEL